MPVSPTLKEFTNEVDASRYTLHVGGELVALVDYRVNGNSISFPHTYTQPAHRGRGFAADIVEYAVNDVEATSTRTVVPMCWYVADWFEAHPDRAGLLSAR